MHEIIIEPGRGDRQYWKDLWRYRELFYFLAWRDLLVRYKQTVVGVAWGFVRPFVTLSVLTIVFGYLAKMPAGNVPYPLVVFCGILPWQFFSGALSESGGSLVGNSGLISKVYFPRLIIPASTAITNLVDLLIASLFLSGLMLWYRFLPGPRIFLVPLFVLLALGTALGVGLWVGALMVKYRDFRHIVPFAVQFGLYISPVGYISQVVYERWGHWASVVYSLNPMVGVIDGFRWAILGGEHQLHLANLTVSCLVTAILLVSGIRYFRRTERTFADVI
jgi:lipopolysaccharide transport system permease protein